MIFKMVAYLSLFLYGILIGLSIAMPIGTLDILCIRNTLSRGKLFGFITGLGVATADALCAFVAGLGVSSFTSSLMQYTWELRIFGGIFLCVLGLVIILSKHHPEQTMTPKKFLTMYLTTFMITLTNPATVLSYISVYAALGLGFQERISISILTLGVFLGSCFWWFFLCSSAIQLKSKLQDSHLAILNAFSGIIFLCMGFIILLKMW